jgi:hypothetical protein
LNSRRLVLLSLLAATITPAIAAKLSKADVQYQDKPKAGGRDCNDCIQFVPDPARKAVGSCRVVEGEVSARGYCLAFTPRPSIRKEGAS